MDGTELIYLQNMIFVKHMGFIYGRRKLEVSKRASTKIWEIQGRNTKSSADDSLVTMNRRILNHVYIFGWLMENRNLLDIIQNLLTMSAKNHMQNSTNTYFIHKKIQRFEKKPTFLILCFFGEHFKLFLKSFGKDKSIQVFCKTINWANLNKFSSGWCNLPKYWQNRVKMINNRNITKLFRKIAKNNEENLQKP